MSLSRRSFMKMVGISVSSLFLMQCRLLSPTCYAPMPPSPTPPASARGRLRACWTRFDELAQAAIEESSKEGYDNVFGKQLLDEHLASLEPLISSGEITKAVADLVQEAYEAAVFHVWRSNVPITCYEPVMVDYAPASANVLVKQVEALEQVAGAGNVDPATVELARAALEHDMAFYALSSEEVDRLYERLIAEWQSQQQAPPTFENVDFEVTPDAEAAARFIVELLIAP